MYRILNGGSAKDARGEIRFVNDLDMSEIKRFYLIKNLDLSVVRGWRGHRRESRWFYSIAGSFRIDLLKIDDWETPSNDIEIIRQNLTSENHQMLHIPPGYATTIQALEHDSELLVFANSKIEDALADDFTWPLTYFINRKI